MANIDISELLELSQDEPRQNSILRTIKREANVYQVFFDKEIGAPELYRDLINLLYISTPNDEFNFFINSPGGYLSSTMAIIEGIKSCDSIVRAIITGECHSAASMLTLNCHEIIVTDAAHMMVHTANFGAGGTVSNVQKHADFSTKHINRIIDSTYEGFLTKEELDKVKMGVEMWFDDEEIGTRLTTRSELMTKKRAAEEKAESKSKKKTDK